jgi:hypothetical protein
VAHECIIDLRGITRDTGVTVDDVAKRLIDYGFHAPTMSFPVAGTLMIEPTESESRAELDRFCEAMIAIRGEIDRVAAGEWPAAESPLRHAPHTAEDLLAADWSRPYDRELGAYPLRSLRRDKYWPPVGRIDGGYGDRNLVCACPPPEAFESPPTSNLPPNGERVLLPVRGQSRREVSGGRSDRRLRRCEPWPWRRSTASATSSSCRPACCRGRGPTGSLESRQAGRERRRRRCGGWGRRW